ncbi:MAG: 30S ribosomal protein S4e [Thermoplasmata archaeon]|uniref:Small ribosomal subunit protein eS4 n=1 Tax=Candidatus Sysuiplasma superficiale TaxID=2823368 RepID=A0A8J7YUD3_9ARCH|nr:30S ribosomal protein S4e [Candidatus Sysuiplasma superficiale]MBX8644677.1 30S ribosomal protein S4e [Candidatus Sysuiplasma superficiale]
MPGRVKRIAAPGRWPVQRKTSYWAVKPSSGPHEEEFSMPLLSVVRDMLHLCNNSREAKLMINGGLFSVDGRVRKDYAFPVGIMDVVTVRGEEGGYRMSINRRSKMHLVPIPQSECSWKICRVEGKRILPGGKVQIALHDGRTLLSDVKVRTGDVIRLEVPEQKVLDVLPLRAGMKALVTGGSHVGEIATVSRFEKWRNPAPNLVYFSEGFSTVWSNVFVAGTEDSVIKVPEVSAV